MNNIDFSQYDSIVNSDAMSMDSVSKYIELLTESEMQSSSLILYLEKSSEDHSKNIEKMIDRIRSQFSSNVNDAKLLIRTKLNALKLPNKNTNPKKIAVNLADASEQISLIQKTKNRLEKVLSTGNSNDVETIMREYDSDMAKLKKTVILVSTAIPVTIAFVQGIVDGIFSGMDNVVASHADFSNSAKKTKSEAAYSCEKAYTQTSEDEIRIRVNECREYMQKVYNATRDGGDDE